MALWGFSKENGLANTVGGANTAAGIKAGNQPPFVAGSAQAGEMAEKRNIIATAAGWIRREHRTSYTNSVATNRTIDQIIVAANPGIPNKDYTSNTYLGNADIAQIYVKLNANGFISANSSANLYVVFNTPICQRASGNLCSVTISNTVGGNSALAYFSNTATARITNANNTLVFAMTPLQANSRMDITFPDNTITNTVANVAFSVDGVAFDSTEVDVIAATNGATLATTFAPHSQLTGAVWTLGTLTLTLYGAQGAVFLVTGNTAFVNSTSGDIAGEVDTITSTSTYKIATGNVGISGTGNPLYNPDDGITASANLVITGAVANNLTNTLGQRITSFQVRIGG